MEESHGIRPIVPENHAPEKEGASLSKHRKDTAPKGSKTARALARFSQIGITMAASVLIGVLLGKYLDRLFGTSPWLLLVFSLLGAGAAIRSLFMMSDDDKR